MLSSEDGQLPAWFSTPQDSRFKRSSTIPITRLGALFIRISTSQGALARLIHTATLRRLRAILIPQSFIISRRLLPALPFLQTEVLWPWARVRQTRQIFVALATPTRMPAS